MRDHRSRSITTGALIIGALTLLALVPACSSSSTPAALAITTTTTTPPPVTVPNQNPAEITACTATAKVVEVALGAFMAEKGAYPTPPAPWSAATYAANYLALTSSGGGGPFLPQTPPTASYVIAYDSAGHVWVAPPGSYGPYNKAQDIDVSPDICGAAIG